jgi:hypothetical protein
MIEKAEPYKCTGRVIDFVVLQVGLTDRNTEPGSDSESLVFELSIRSDGE